MANLWGALQSTINTTKIRFRAITATILDEGEASERRAVDMVIRDEDNNLLGGTDNPLKVEASGVELSAEQIDLNTDGLETLIGTTNTKLDTLDTRVDGLESLIGTTNTNTKQLRVTSKDITSSDLTTNAYTFSPNVAAVAVKNDGTSDLTVTISTLVFTIKPGESRIIELAASFSVVTFSAGAVFRMNGLTRS